MGEERGRPRSRRTVVAGGTRGRFIKSLLVMMIAFAGVLSACAGERKSVRKVRGDVYEIRDIDLHGVERFKKDDLLAHLNMNESAKVLRRPKYYYSEATIPVDTRRILELYAAYGYYDARVIDVRVSLDERRKTAKIDVWVEEGPPVLIRRIEFRWPEGPPRRPPKYGVDPKASPEMIQAKGKTAVADRQPFEVAAIERAATDMQIALKNRGYPFAEVREWAQVDRDRRTADVMFYIRPGPWAAIADIRIEGLYSVPEDLVRNEIDWAVGRQYSTRLVHSVEQAAFAMEVFTSVSVVVEPEQREALEANRVTLVVRVHETKPQYTRVGLGFEVNPNRWEQRGFLQYRHNNLAGRLLRFDGRVAVGWAELPALYRPEAMGPIFLFQPHFEKKGLLEKRLVWTFQPEFEVGIQEGYQFWSPRNRIGVSRFITRFVELGASHNLRFVDFFNVSPALMRQAPAARLGLEDPYFLSYVQFQFHLHLVDRILQPRNGARLTTTYDISSQFLGSQFDYHKLVPELRAYWQAHKRVQLAWRFGTGLIFPFADNPDAPIDMRLYLGGPDSIRGFGLRRLSPQVITCPPEKDRCDDIPIGGFTSVIGSFEARVQIVKMLHAVAFADAGDVQPGQLDYRPDQWNYTAGPGLRLDTPVGKLRLDVGFRLNRVERFDDEPIWALHFGLGEAF